MYLAPVYSTNRLTARIEAICVSRGSTPRSNRREASVDNLCERAFLAISTGSKCAASIVIALVLEVTSDSNPPIVPAIAKAPESSAINKFSANNSRSCSSRVLIVLISFANRTVMEPLMRSESNACKGCPSSIIT